ncbi:unnamed protein product [Dovyalis caffra]|uniref:Uncharacterized protein n=1 Tax=Dovyalis caffra TaxID=77055 RepID=A0AAV1RB45_9ROSI|nr:unnamed protein product [Dovyalis caffra]
MRIEKVKGNGESVPILGEKERDRGVNLTRVDVVILTGRVNFYSFFARQVRGGRCTSSRYSPSFCFSFVSHSVLTLKQTRRGFLSHYLANGICPIVSGETMVQAKSCKMPKESFAAKFSEVKGIPS